MDLTNLGILEIWPISTIYNFESQLDYTNFQNFENFTNYHNLQFLPKFKLKIMGQTIFIILEIWPIFIIYNFQNLKYLVKLWVKQFSQFWKSDQFS